MGKPIDKLHTEIKHKQIHKHKQINDIQHKHKSKTSNNNNISIGQTMRNYIINIRKDIIKDIKRYKLFETDLEKYYYLKSKNINDLNFNKNTIYYRYILFNKKYTLYITNKILNNDNNSFYKYILYKEVESFKEILFTFTNIDFSDNYNDE